MRFELGYHYFGPKVKIIAPWRIWKLNSRTDLIKYAKKNNIPIPTDKKGAPPFSIDDNLYHTSTEGKVLENPKNSAEFFGFSKTLPSVDVWYKLSSIEKGGAPFLSVGIGILFFFAYLIKSVLEFNFHILHGAIIFTFGPK